VVVVMDMTPDPDADMGDALVENIMDLTHMHV